MVGRRRGSRPRRGDAAPGLSRLAFATHYATSAGLGHPHVHGANLGTRADAYQRAGGWEALHLAEEHDLWCRLRAAGERCLATTTLWVTTSGRARGRAHGGFADLLGGGSPAGPDRFETRTDEPRQHLPVVQSGWSRTSGAVTPRSCERHRPPRSPRRSEAVAGRPVGEPARRGSSGTRNEAINVPSSTLSLNAGSVPSETPGLGLLDKVDDEVVANSEIQSSRASWQRFSSSYDATGSIYFRTPIDPRHWPASRW